jgi:hypothetical protein
MAELRNSVRSKTSYALKDYYWYPRDMVGALFAQLGGAIGGLPGMSKLVEYFDTSVTIKNTAKVLLTEFEPQSGFKSTQEFYQNILKTFKSLFNKPEAFSEKFKSIFSIESLEAALSTSNTGGDKDIFQIPNSFYNQLLKGKYIASFEVPYFDNHFLHAKGAEGWSASTLQEKLGGKIGESILGVMGFGNLNIAVRPRFDLDGSGPMADAIDIEFFLYNETAEALAANINFLTSLASGPLWVQSGFLQRSSNLYDVDIPGRLHYYFCTMDLQIDYHGKTRRLGTDAYGVVQGTVNSAFLSEYISKDSLVPDGYKLKISLQSLVPNNFNIFASVLTGRDPKHAIDSVIESSAIEDILKKLRS